MYISLPYVDVCSQAYSNDSHFVTSDSMTTTMTISSWYKIRGQLHILFSCINFCSLL